MSADGDLRADEHRSSSLLSRFRSSSLALRLAVGAFVGVEVYAFVLWLSIGRYQWFYADEWDFLSLRTGGNLGDLFRPHHGHWTTVPILIYRLLYALVGLRVFLPYRLVVLVLYLAASALLFVVMLRAAVHPWIAAAAASLFALYGAGADNIINPFQVTFTGALVSGLAFLLLTDRDGPLARRDLFGLLAGLIGLMMSGVGVAMVLVTGIAVTLRRGWRIAASLVAPLAAVYLVWFAIIGHQSGVTQARSPARIVTFVSDGFRGGFGRMGPFAWFGVLLMAMLVVGFPLAFRQRSPKNLGPLAAPFALLCGAVLLLVLVESDHGAVLASGSATTARLPRYLSLVAALSLPAVAVAADAFARVWRWLLPIAIAMFLVGVPQNLSTARHFERIKRPLFAGTQLAVETVARDPRARAVPPTLHPLWITAPDLTAGWLVGALAHHKIPPPRALTPTLLAEADFRLSFYQTATSATDEGCPTLTRPMVIAFARDEVIRVYGNALLLVPASHLPVWPGMVFDPAEGNSIRATRHVGRVVLIPYHQRRPPRVCVGRRGASG